MPNATTRLSLVEPLSTDATTEYRTSITANATTLDAAVLITEGTLASRPTTGLFYGKTYFATDNGIWYFYNGSAWEAVMAGGAWTSLTLGNPGSTLSAVSGGYTPSYRQVGDIVYFSGAIQSAGSTSDGGTWATALPHPASVAHMAISIDGTSPASNEFLVSTSGVMTLVSGSSSSVSAALDGLSYRLI